MQAKPRRPAPTLTEQARRAQIVAATIATIAEADLAKASFTRIAERAKLSSTGLISYHFAGRQDLLDEVVRTVTADFTAYVLARGDDGTPAGGLRTFLAASLDFMRDHRAHLVAMLRVQLASPPTDGSTAHLAASDRAKLAELLADGQRSGDFRDFDTDVMAGFILSLRNGVIARVAAEPGFDPAACAAELLRVVELATRREPT
ncbi:TetR/AcrR family transcriptional regulator [Phytomonospora endophytica]|uniref:AcrR family transcriptional regulator n=1 Tax=Phytomonospora endophytica TaxID=714109 RepID=A0A841FL81_9ACTN|nr:TetR family transcriptional regulator [Phytomonospora endophytica]MBB6033947.1 AcrR family transcriptional regulator [Phytomonospora endophytica]GIG64532.1 TetR family transcriptional regulator [Phytomonospora endophytica]